MSFKFNSGQITHQSPVEVSMDVAPRPSLNLQVTQHHSVSEFAELARDITSLSAEGRDIRNQVETLIVWRRYIGEGSAAPTWGPTQQAHAGQRIEYLRKRYSNLKSAIEAEGKSVSEIIEYIFSEKCRGQHSEEVTKEALEELGEANMDEKTLEEKIASATNSQEIRELCIQSGEKVGYLVRERDGRVVVKDTAPSLQPAVARPEPESNTLLRRAVRLDNGNVRLIEAYSDSGLDMLQKYLLEGH